MHTVGKQGINRPEGSSQQVVNPLFEEHGGIQLQAVRLDFPKFNGMILMDGSIGQISFFAYHQNNLYHRVLLVSFHMEGKDLVWFQDLEAFGSITS